MPNNEPEFIDRINNPQNYPFIDKTEKGAFMDQELKVNTSFQRTQVHISKG